MKLLIFLFTLLTVNCFAAPQPSTWNNPWSTNRNLLPVMGTNSLAVSNTIPGGSRWNFYGNTLNTVARFGDITNAIFPLTPAGIQNDIQLNWTTGGVFSPTISPTNHSGTNSCLLGAVSGGSEPNGDSFVFQTVQLPEFTNGFGLLLSFWVNCGSDDTIAFDWQECQIRDSSSNLLDQVFKLADDSRQWRLITWDMTRHAGQMVQIYFNAHGDGATDFTWMYLDDVSIRVVPPDGSPWFDDGTFIYFKANDPVTANAAPGGNPPFLIRRVGSGLFQGSNVTQEIDILDPRWRYFSFSLINQKMKNCQF